MIWREEERSRIKAVLMDNLRGLLGIRRMDRVPIAQNGELCVVVKGVDERIDESVLWFGLMERMKNMISKRVYVGGCVGIHLVSLPKKRWVDSVNDCSKKRGLNVGQARRKVYDRNEW